MELKEFKMLTPFSIKNIPSNLPNDSPSGILEPEVAVVDETGDEVIIISGYANYSGVDERTGVTYLDLVNDVVVPAGVDTSVWESNPQILWQHDREDTIGKGIKIEKRVDGLYIEATIHKSAMSYRDFYKIKSGLVNHFSVGFRTIDGEWKDVGNEEAWFITRSLLLEVSVVGIPANSPSKFQIVKSDDGIEGFRVEDLNKVDKESTVDETKSITEDTLPMKVKVTTRDLVSEAKSAELEAAGVDVSAEVEVELSTYIAGIVKDSVDAAFAAKAEEEAKEAREAKEAQDVLDATKAEEDAKAELVAKEEADAKATEDAAKAEEAEAVAVKAFADQLAQLKAELGITEEA
jgi:HK97 family phage prohead protease